MTPHLPSHTPSCPVNVNETVYVFIEAYTRMCFPRRREDKHTKRERGKRERKVRTLSG